jgi:O-antigen biosynthesis protein WbqV
MLAGRNEDLAFPLLLERPLIKPSRAVLESVCGKRVLLTGAGGSIGSELALQVAEHGPASLVLVDHSELALYEINATLANAEVPFRVFPALADVRDRSCLNRLFQAEEPELVLHAAALKHVPLLESPHNLVEAVQTNVGGTVNVAEMCGAYDAPLVVISTDKAVNPSSVMGLTKRVAELAVFDEASRWPAMRAAVVRFGNVLGSSGSVVPLFRRQIAHGGPVTVTHPEMTRFMMSIREAVYLVLQTSAQPFPARSVAVYVLEMGEPVKIADLARQLIRMVGLRPGEDIDIVYTGIRPGEKLHEELHYAAETPHPTGIAGARGFDVPVQASGVWRRVRQVLDAAVARDALGLRALLRELVPEYAANTLANEHADKEVA